MNHLQSVSQSLELPQPIQPEPVYRPVEQLDMPACAQEIIDIGKAVLALRLSAEKEAV